MLITEFVDVRITGGNIKHYRNLGYEEKYGSFITIPVEYLQKSSKIKVEVECDYCGKHIFKTYQQYLIGRETIPKDTCKKCSKLKVKDVCLEKYNVENVMQVNEYKENLKSAMLNKYGVESPMHVPEFKNKVIETCIEKYGTSSPSSNEEVKEKTRQTCLQKYGYDSYSKTEDYKLAMSNFWNNLSETKMSDVKNKRRKTIIDRYGVENLMDFSEFKEKQKQTMLDKYGVEYPSQMENHIIKIREYWDNLSFDELKEITDKREITMLEKYGTSNPLSVPSIKKKYIATCLENYGVESPMQSKEVRDKFCETFENKYGVKYPLQFDEFKEKFKNTCIARYGVCTYLLLPEVREKAINSYIEINGIPTSKPQLEIYNILSMWYKNNITLNYKYSYYFLDVALTLNELKIDIEYDGWYWHKDKTEKDNQRNIFLINNNWKVLRIKSRYDLPTIEELKNKLNILINTEEKYQEIILDDWGDKEVAV